MISTSEIETKKIANQLLDKYKKELEDKCLIFALEGDLGSGKTIFAKGVAEALGIKKVIRSPSFIIQREFPYKIDNLNGNFVHIDLWRMENEREVEKLKIEGLVKPGNVVLIEWAEKMGSLLNKITKIENSLVLRVKLRYINEKTRKIETEVE